MPRNDNNNTGGAGKTRDAGSRIPGAGSGRGRTSETGKAGTDLAGKISEAGKAGTDPAAKISEAGKAGTDPAGKISEAGKAGTDPAGKTGRAGETGRATSPATVILKKGKEQSVRRYHPWIFSGAISSVSGNPKEGDVAEIYAWDKTYLATGHWAPGSIAVRILSFEKCGIDREFFRKRLADAFRYRINSGIAGRSDTNVWRLVHGEGDGLPGLVVDIYGSVAVLQAHTAGFWHIRQMIADLIPEVTGGLVTAVYDKSEGTLPFMAKLNPVNGYLTGGPSGDLAGGPGGDLSGGPSGDPSGGLAGDLSGGPAEDPSGGPAGDLSGGLIGKGTVVTENGFKFRIDWEKGQKTGFFIDQRDSRSLLRQYSNGRKVLNMFGYTGGFSVYAMSNASLVHTVDSSAAATALADENINLNFGDDPRHRSFTADAFSFLSGMDREYDLIILDPPAFAKHQTALNQALQGYRRLNAMAIQKIKPGGILFTFSCSQVVSRDDFRRSVFVAAANTGRNVRILHQTGQPADHPVNIYHPESEYLKGLVLYIE